MLDERARAALGKRVTDGLAKLGYRGAGTVEFLYQDGELYFIEMNTRLQVEHPVTEMITGIDLVRAQIEIAAGEPLRLAQEDITFDGHAIEVRINAEDPKTLLPTPGRVEAYHAPAGPGVRVDSALYAGATVPPYYDSLIAKLIVHDRSRAPCLSRLRRALGEYVIAGLPTSHPAAARDHQGSGVRRGRLPHRLVEPGSCAAGKTPLERARARLLCPCAPAMPQAMPVLTPDLLLCAYASGLFPMANDRHDPTIHWIDPRRRGVLPLHQFHQPKSLRKVIRRGQFEIRVDSDFAQVIEACAEVRAAAPAHLAERRTDRALSHPASARLRAQRRGLGRRTAGRRPVRGVAWRRLLRRKHVHAHARCQQGRAGRSGRAPAGRAATGSWTRSS